MRIFRRFAMLGILGWWLGGLTLYATTVIRSAHQVIGNHAKVGFITQRVTTELNWIGVGALALMLWNGAASWRAGGPWPRRTLAASWIMAAAAHAAVFLLHARLDGMLDFQARQVRDDTPFRGTHETYLIATTVEWAAALVYLLSALSAWLREDS